MIKIIILTALFIVCLIIGYDVGYKKGFLDMKKIAFDAIDDFCKGRLRQPD